METFSALLALCGGIHRSPVNSPHKGQWRGGLMFSLIYARTNGWVNNRNASHLRRHHAHYNVTVMHEKSARASIHKADGRLIARSREDLKPRDSYLYIFNRSDIWQAPHQKHWRDACQISERYDDYSNRSRGFESSRDFSVRRLSA